MQIHEIHKLLNTSYYPIMDYKGNVVQGLKVKTDSNCEQCQKECIKDLATLKNFEVQQCVYGLVYFKITLFDKLLIIFGLSNDYYKLDRNEKKKYTKKLAFNDMNLVRNWSQELSLMFGETTSELEKQEKNNSDFIHDMKKIYSSILRKIEDYLTEQCDDLQNIDDCAIDKNIISIWHNVRLLEHQFKVIDYISNPESTTYGQLRSKAIYKIIDKLGRILAVQKHKIKLKGTSHNQLFVYDSFITLPFVLIDNAIKYSLDNQDIEILVNDTHENNGVEVSIASYSPLITEEDKKSIFKKYYRGNETSEAMAEGKGLGLYLAKVIADAHRTSIEISSTGSITNYDGVNYQLNTFSFTINCLNN